MGKYKQYYSESARFYLYHWYNSRDNESFQLETSGGNNPVWQLYHDQTYPIGPIINSNWTHLGVTFSNQNLSLYLNGQLTSNITVGVGEKIILRFSN